VNNGLKKWLLSGAGFALTLTVLGYAGKYLVAQEAEKVVAPVRGEQQATSAAIAEMKWKARYDESQEAMKECVALRDDEPYCAAEDEWRWEVYYPYLDCIAGLPYKEREGECGPEPEFLPAVWNQGGGPE
jgi:hypothetical protein